MRTALPSRHQTVPAEFAIRTALAQQEPQKIQVTLACTDNFLNRTASFNAD